MTLDEMATFLGREPSDGRVAARCDRGLFLLRADNAPTGSGWNARYSARSCRLAKARRASEAAMGAR